MEEEDYYNYDTYNDNYTEYTEFEGDPAYLDEAGGATAEAIDPDDGDAAGFVPDRALMELIALALTLVFLVLSVSFNLASIGTVASHHGLRLEFYAEKIKQSRYAQVGTKIF